MEGGEGASDGAWEEVDAGGDGSEDVEGVVDRLSECVSAVQEQHEVRKMRINIGRLEGQEGSGTHGGDSPRMETLRQTVLLPFLRNKSASREDEERERGKQLIRRRRVKTSAIDRWLAESPSHRLKARRYPSRARIVAGGRGKSRKKGDFFS